MKSIISKKRKTEILVDDLFGKEIIAYRCKSNRTVSNYAILSKLSKSGTRLFGFIPVGESDSGPRFVGSTWREAVERASEYRDLKIFDSPSELIEAMYNKSF